MASGDLEALQAKGISIDPGPWLGGYYIAMNTQDPVFCQAPRAAGFPACLFNWKPLASTTMKVNGFIWQWSKSGRACRALRMESQPATTTIHSAPRNSLLAKPAIPENGLKKTLFPCWWPPADHGRRAAGERQGRAGVDFEVVPGEHTPDFRSRKYQVLVGNSRCRAP